MKPIEALDHAAAAGAEIKTSAQPKATPHPPKKADFVIVVSLETENGKTDCVPRNIPAVMHPGDTVTYMSPDGTVQIDFDPDSEGSGHTSPYADTTGDLPTVKGGVLLNVVNKGTYFGHCSIFDAKTGVASATWGATSGSAASGGNHVVK